MITKEDELRPRWVLKMSHGARPRIAKRAKQEHQHRHNLVGTIDLASVTVAVTQPMNVPIRIGTPILMFVAKKFSTP